MGSDAEDDVLWQGEMENWNAGEMLEAKKRCLGKARKTIPLDMKTEWGDRSFRLRCSDLGWGDGHRQKVATGTRLGGGNVHASNLGKEDSAREKEQYYSLTWWGPN